MLTCLLIALYKHFKQSMIWKTVFLLFVNNQSRCNMTTYSQVSCSTTHSLIHSSSLPLRERSIRPPSCSTTFNYSFITRGSTHHVRRWGMERGDCVIEVWAGALRPCAKRTTPPPVFPLIIPFFLSLGPLMPENLDVRNIPGSKRRDLTVDLCGKLCRAGV